MVATSVITFTLPEARRRRHFGHGVGCRVQGRVGFGPGREQLAQVRQDLGVPVGTEVTRLPDGGSLHKNEKSIPYKDAALADENCSRSASVEKWFRKESTSSLVGRWNG